MWSVLNCLDILSEDKDAATSSTADSLLKNIFCFNFVLGIMVPNSVLISIVYLHLLSTAVPAAAAHLPRAQPEVGAGRGGDQPVRGGDTLGCRVSATMVAVWMLCEKYRFDLANLASVPTSLVQESISLTSLVSTPLSPATFAHQCSGDIVAQSHQSDDTETEVYDKLY